MATSVIKHENTVSASYNNGIVTAYRTGNVVTIRINLAQTGQVTANAWTYIANLDSQFIPSTPLDFPIINNAASSTSNWTLQCRITGAGAVGIYSFSSAVTPLGTVTYVV